MSVASREGSYVIQSHGIGRPPWHPVQRDPRQGPEGSIPSTYVVGWLWVPGDGDSMARSLVVGDAKTQYSNDDKRNASRQHHSGPQFILVVNPYRKRGYLVRLDASSSTFPRQRTSSIFPNHCTRSRKS